ncbi:zinc finger protein jing-like isoform 1-T1 [Glossina fuscipes fuscipes]
MSSIKKLVDNKQQLTVLALFNNSKNSEKDDVSGGDLCDSQVLQSVINLSQEQNKSEEALKSTISAYSSSVPHFESQLSLLKNEKQPNATTMPTDVMKIDESNSNLSKKQATSSETFDSSGTSFIRLKKHNSSLKANAEKTKRCTDRYDSSESSDSGVATSVSCTDSNIGSNEDASEPNSPLSGHLGSCDDLQHLPKTSIKIVNERTKMSPQTLKEINTSVTSTPPQNLISVSVSNMSRDVNGGGTTIVNSSKLKLPVEKTVKKSYNDAKNATMLPVLQWPWNSSSAVGTGTHSSQVQAKKRLASQSNGGDNFLSKKARSCAAVSIISNTDGQTVKITPNSNGGANVSKRLRNASLEESQTKITGYFKSQMKLQMPLSNGSAKQTGITNSPVNGVSTKSSCLKPNNLAMNAPATTASLNKYFNVLAQIKENNGDNRLCSNIEVSNESKAESSEESPSLLAPQRSATMPALKKIERSKPTKIAQVAPNLRKVSSSSSYNNSLSSAEINGKSPIKRHVAIAPRTPEMKQQSKPVLTKPESSKSFTAAHQPTNSTSQPPTVLLTAIRLPPTQPTASKQVCQVTKSTPHSTPSNTNTAVANTASGSTTVYQLPLQIPNLVQLPHLLATNSSNMMQLNNLGPTSAVAKTASTNTTPSATTSAQAAQSAASQYFLNGTVFKLQQFTTATTTTATSAASSNPNPFNFLSASDLQELILKQQQQKAAITTTTTSFQEIFQQQIAAAVAASQQQQAQFQQLQRMNNAANISQPVFMTTPAGLLLNAASLPTMLAQAAAVIAVSNQQSQQQKAIALPALQPIQQNPLPALSSIFAPQTQQPEQGDIQQQQIAQLALTQQQQQFITSTQPPPLSSVTLNISNNLSPLQTALQKQPQSVAPKLTLVKATASPTSYPTLSSQPPPLVTISNAKGRSHLVTHATTVNSSSNLCTKALIQKQSAQTKPYQKNATKLAATHAKIANSHVNKVKTSKIGMTSGKIFATSTTPPPLVPTIQTKALQVVPSKANLIASRPSPNCVSQASPLFTPSLVSIVNTSTTTPRISKDAFTSTGGAKAHIDKTAILSKSKNCGCTSVSNSSSATIESSDTSVSFSNVCNKLLEKLEGNDSKMLDKPKPTADLFDLIKNSKSVPAEIPKNISRKPLPLSNSFYDIKDEPLEESSALAIISSKKCNDFKETDLVSSTNIKRIDIKKEQLNGNASENEKIHDVIHQENSSSSFSSHTNSTSSRTDISLETSTLTTISATPSSCSASMEPTSPNSNLQLCMINNSTPLTCVTGVLSQDTLSEMVALTCSLPESEESSVNMSSKTFRDKALVKETQSRVLPSPESGICGSFSRNESSDSCAKSPTSTLCPTTVAQLRQLSGKEKRVFSNSESINIELPREYHITSEAAICPIDTKLTEAAYVLLPKSTISPILSQPKTIRFPPESRCFLGTKTGKRSDGVCHWNKCNQKYESNSKLLDHMQNQHVNIQTGPFSCLWVGCKVYNKESCSRRWLERHVLSHGGSKQFKCIVEGCGLRFGSQLALQKHVNNHFTATESKEGSNKRTSDPPVPKQLRKNGKKLRYRRQPFSARMFDFFDAGIMEALQHRLRQISTLTNGYGCITFQGQCVLRRKTFAGSFECFIRWSPGEIISDEWLPESEEPYVKTINIKHMQPAEKNKVENLLMTAFKLPYSPRFFECEARLSKQNLQLEYDNDSTTTSDSDDGKCINDVEEKTPPAGCPLTNYISDHRTTICEGVQKERKQRRKSLRHFV